MATIIAGRFEQQDSAERAVEELLRAGFAHEHVTSFYLNPPGQHATYSLGGDHDKSAGAKQSGKGAAAGVAAGAAAGLAATPVLGPLGAVAGGLVGAHLGGLIGGLSQMKDAGDSGEHGEDPENLLPAREAGMYVAVAVTGDDAEERAVELLNTLGAADLETAQGTIADGDWTDFDPSIAPQRYARTPRGPGSGASSYRT
ncbi:MAG TPA: hypothetical protein VIG66_05135 [Noviherbaspirillum sp.]